MPATRELIVDFTTADDTIQFAASAFSGLTPGPLGDASFVVGNGPADAQTRIIYNDATGALFYDPDGTGSGRTIQIATLQAGLDLTADDFVVV